MRPKFWGILALAFISVINAHADKWSSPEPSAYVSPSGRYVLRILPGDPEKKRTAMAAVFEFNTQTDGYTKKLEFFLLNKASPVDACISDTGEVCTFDDWGRMGYEHVAVWYSAEGKVRASYTLEQLIPAKHLRKIREEQSTVSSVHWRKGTPQINGNRIYLNDALGGYISLGAGDLEYVPAEKAGR